MSKKALIDQKHSAIKAHILDPDNSPLDPQQKEMLDRIITVAKILDKNPVQKNAVSIHRAKYPEISKSQAYEDVKLAVKLFNTIHTFDYDFWHMWLLNDIADNIKRCKESGTPSDRRVIAMEHANLFKALGDKPDPDYDPERNEKHNFYILVQNNKQEFKIDLNKLDKVPVEVKESLTKELFSGEEIDFEDAEKLIDS
jgi:hypothetical protein